MLLCCGKDKDDIGGRFLQGLEEGVEGSTGKHVDLVDDEHLVTPRLRRNEHLLAELTDVLHGIIAGSIQFVDVHGTLLVEGLATLTLAAWLATILRVKAINGLCENAGTGGLAHTTGTAKEIGMSQLTGTDGILQRGSQ